MCAEIKACKESKVEGKPRKRRIRNFFKRHKEGITCIGRVAVLSALVGIGSASPPLIKETPEYYGIDAVKITEIAEQKGMTQEERDYLFKILNKASSCVQIIGHQRTYLDGWAKKIVFHPKFEPVMLEFLGIFFLEEGRGQNPAKDLALFHSFLGEGRLDAKTAGEAIRQHDKYGGRIIAYIEEYGKYREVGPKNITRIRERFGDDYPEMLNGFKSIFENPNIERSGFLHVSPTDMWRALQIIKKNSGERFSDANALVLAYYSNPNFGKQKRMDLREVEKASKKATQVCRKYGITNGSRMSNSLEAILKNPNFSIDSIEEYAKNLTAFIPEIEKGWKNDSVWDIIYKLLRSPAVFPKMLEPKDRLWIAKILQWKKKSKGDQRNIQAVEDFANGQYAQGIVLGGENEVRKLWKTFKFATKKMDGEKVKAIGQACSTDSKGCKEVFEKFCKRESKRCMVAAEMISWIKRETGSLSEDGKAVEFLSDLVLEKRKDAPAQDALSALIGTHFEKMKHPQGFDGIYLEGKRLAQKLGARNCVATWLNFAFANAEVGPEMTTRMYGELGIEYFTRYSGREWYNYPDGPTTLKIIANSLEKKYSRPVFLMATAKSDWNGAFGQMKYHDRDFEKNHHILAVEADSDIELLERIKQVADNHGKIDILLLSGHGSPSSIRIGNRENGLSELSSRDHKKLEEVGYAFSSEPTIILNSCSTGAWKKGGIAHVVSKALKARVIAPKKPTGILDLEYDPNSGRIEVEYDGGAVNAREFENLDPERKKKEMVRFAGIMRSLDKFAKERTIRRDSRDHPLYGHPGFREGHPLEGDVLSDEEIAAAYVAYTKQTNFLFFP